MHLVFYQHTTGLQLLPVSTNKPCYTACLPTYLLFQVQGFVYAYYKLKAFLELTHRMNKDKNAFVNVQTSFFFLHMYLNKPAKNHLLKCTQTHSSANKFVSTYVSRYIFQGVLTLILFSLKVPSKYTLCCVMTTALPCRWSSSHMPMYFSPLGGK